jgi:hypothetical protein
MASVDKTFEALLDDPEERRSLRPCIAWCSRPRNRATLPATSLVDLDQFGEPREG